MADLGFEFQTILSDIARILLAFALALPIGGSDDTVGAALHFEHFR